MEHFFTEADIKIGIGNRLTTDGLPLADTLPVSAEVVKFHKVLFALVLLLSTFCFVSFSCDASAPFTSPSSLVLLREDEVAASSYVPAYLFCPPRSPPRQPQYEHKAVHTHARSRIANCGPSRAAAAAERSSVASSTPALFRRYLNHRRLSTVKYSSPLEVPFSGVLILYGQQEALLSGDSR